MRILTLALTAVLILVAVLVGLNWQAIVTPSAVSLGVTTVQMPLGLSLLVLLGVVTVLFTTYVVFLQGSALMDARRLRKDLHAHRELADKAEASRFTELRQILEDIEARQRTVIEQTGNSLAASLGELEDKVERALGQAPRG
ncbi:MAG: LapA family protein [Aquabacterium sp.]|jgi:hypothetical protein